MVNEKSNWNKIKGISHTITTLELITNIHFYANFSTFSHIKCSRFSPFNYTSWSLNPKPSSMAFWLLLYLLSILIRIVNSCIVCVFYFCIFSNTLDLFKATYFITLKNQESKYHCTIDLLFDWFGISCTTTDSFWFFCKTD
jgi:hypothetical protein